MRSSYLSVAVAASILLASAQAVALTSRLDRVEHPGGVDVREAEPEAVAFLETVDVVEELVGRELRRTATAPGADSTPSGRFEAAGTSTLPPPLERLLRLADPDYADGISAMAGAGRPSPREISNRVFAQSGSIPSDRRVTDMLWQWGQFVDHDIDLTGTTETEPAPIPVPLGDPFFDPLGEGGKVIPFSRSIYDPATGTDLSSPRQQMNTITGVIDASNVYGSDAERARALRTLDGTGRLRESTGNFLPFNSTGFPNAGGSQRPDLFLAGDVRANEQVGLSTMHTLWMREHNFWADLIGAFQPSLSGGEIYRAARGIVTAEMQIITYRDFLPLLLGRDALGRYTGFDPSVDPRICNEFSTAAYRLGHTMLSSTFQRLDADGTPIPDGPLALRDAFFAPGELVREGLEPYLKGLASQIMQRIDTRVVDDVRSFLFGPPGAGGLDLVSLNIQRGRDHGLPDYNAVRIAYGLEPVASFDEITTDATVRSQLEAAYGNVNDLDVWVGALAEDHLQGELVGELLHASLVEQFRRLRDGDPEWYENRLSPGAARSLESQTLAKVIARNTTLRRQDLQPNVFLLPEDGGEGTSLRPRRLGTPP
jgi:peroxidase